MTQVQISPRHRRIVVPYTEGLHNLVPDAQRFVFNGESLLALPHCEDHTRFARNFGFSAPAPVQHYYDWCGQKPFDVQVQSVAMLTLEPRAFLLNGMGTGKTRTILWAFDWLRRQQKAERMLVVAPLSTLNMTWWREAFRVTPHLKVNVLHGTREKRLAMLADPADIYVVNHDGLDIIKNEVANRRDIDTVAIDELAVYRNGRSKRWKAMNKVVSVKPRVWGATGSPTPEDPTDAWAQIRLIRPNNITSSFTHFRDATMLKVSQFRWVPKPSAMQQVRDAMTPAVRFTLDDVLELPEVVIREVEIEQSQKQIEVYREMEKRLTVQMERGEVTAQNAGILLSKLLQVALGWVYTNDGRTWELEASQRLAALEDAIASTDRKVIVFVPYIHALSGVAEHLKNVGIHCETVSGDTPKRKRDEVFGAFQMSLQPRVLVAHPQCMSHGLTLTAADTIVWFGPIPSLEIFEQANARITRIGQKHKQQVLLFCGSKAERHVYTRLRQKQGVQDALLEMLRERTSAENRA